MARPKPDNQSFGDQDMMLQTLRHAIAVQERLKASVEQEQAFLLSGDYDQVVRTRQVRKQIERDFAGCMATIRTASDTIKAGQAGSELIVLVDRLRTSIRGAAEAVRASIASCEHERSTAARKLGTLRTSKRALDSYARYGGAN